jgi:peptidoglycan/xylan/chitin deacetylase (PgdA/CDA1 family)
MRLLVSVDDGSKADMRIGELVDKYKAECIFYIPVRWEEVNLQRGREPLSRAEFLEIAARFEIGSHTINHPLLTRIDPLAARFEIQRSRVLMQDLTGQRIRSLAWPRGYTNPTLQQYALESGYEDARGVGVGYFHESENRFDVKTTLHAGCDRKEYGGQDWFSYGKYMLEQAKDTPDSIYHIWCHGWELERYPDGLKLFEVLLKELTFIAKG